MDTLVNLIIQLISGVAGGNAAAFRAIAGAAGGSFDLESVASQIIGGDAGGAILTVIAGVVKSMMANRQPS
jgi:hypothetical protein